MKILSIEDIRSADEYTIVNEPIRSIDLMERASSEIFKWLRKRIKKDSLVSVFAGPGNNGGDGLALARMLYTASFKVEVNLVLFTKKFSADFSQNLERLKSLGNIVINEIKSPEDIKPLDSSTIIVDAIFGSGLSRPAKGLAADVIQFINDQPGLRVSIDVPSGLFADKSSKVSSDAIVRADHTLSFQMPKLAFMMPENDEYVGNWQILDIGLHPAFINSADTKNYYIQKRDIKASLLPRKKFAHKGSFGHALLIAGSYGKIGAAVLATKAALRSGLGLLHVHIPKVAYQILQTSCPEAMLSIDRYDNYFSELPDLSSYNSIGVGPGLGTQHQSQMALKLLIQNASIPIVFDADALNILSENKTWLAFLPKNSVLTPHPKEFERLAGKWTDDFGRLDLQRQFAIKHGVTVVLKGAHTSVGLASGDVYFNSTGNAGMACGGSGDVLTGLITGLIARGYPPQKATVFAVYLHGLAGDIAAKKYGQDAMIAGDIIDCIPAAFKKIS
ncbi:MAG: NAD(P)H-hydrate dehydratase [Chlorobi bacterium]|nr:NAD(P)H-hydrate dehydratase [Chlorobiota bacterium]